jgi:hypothetical protein
MKPLVAEMLVKFNLVRFVMISRRRVEGGRGGGGGAWVGHLIVVLIVVEGKFFTLYFICTWADAALGDLLV